MIKIICDKCYKGIFKELSDILVVCPFCGHQNNFMISSSKNLKVGVEVCAVTANLKKYTPRIHFNGSNNKPVCQYLLLYATPLTLTSDKSKVNCKKCLKIIQKVCKVDGNDSSIKDSSNNVERF